MSRHLAVRTFDEVAEISVLNGAFERVAHDMGQLDAELSDGLYVVQVRVGQSVTERIVALDQDRVEWFGKQSFPSPVPFIGTSLSSMRYIKAADDGSSLPRDDLGYGGTVTVFVRDREGKRDAGSGGFPIQEAGLNLAAGLSIRRSDGPVVDRIDIAAQATVLTKGDACASWSATVTPGSWILTLSNADGSEVERAIWIGWGHHVQVFLFRLSYILANGKPSRLVDLGRGTVVISPSPNFRSDDARTRLTELAWDALTQGRHALSRRMLGRILSEKFNDAMLGLVGAHLLIRDRPDDGKSLETVLGNLRRILGEDHPDLLALAHRSHCIEPPASGLRFPPMLRASWDLVVEASSREPNSIAGGSPAAAMAARVLPGTPWLTWDSGSTDADRIRLLTEILGDYVRARSKPNSSRVIVREAGAPRRVLARRKRIRVGSQFLSPFEPGLAKAAPVSPSKTVLALSIPDEERSELARALGVPSEVLVDLLSKLPN